MTQAEVIREAGRKGLSVYFATGLLCHTVRAGSDALFRKFVTDAGILSGDFQTVDKTIYCAVRGVTER